MSTGFRSGSSNDGAIQVDNADIIALSSTGAEAASGKTLTANRVNPASQVEAEAGSDNTKPMTPLRVAQAIAALGGAGGGKTVQVVEGTPYTTYSSTATAIPSDDTIPQSNEGAEWVTATITPTSASNRLVIEATMSLCTLSANNNAIAALFQDSSANALASSAHTPNAVDFWFQMRVRHEMAAGTTSPTTFKLRAGPSAGTMYVNGTSSGRRLGGVAAVKISITEIAT